MTVLAVVDLLTDVLIDLLDLVNWAAEHLVPAATSGKADLKVIPRRAWWPAARAVDKDGAAPP